MTSATLGGFQYDPRQDLLVLSLTASDTLDAPSRAQVMEYPDLGLYLVGMWGEVDRRLRTLSLAQASKHVPSAVLAAPAGRPLRAGPLSDEPGTWLLPLFPEAELVGHNRVALHLPDGQPPLGLLLAKSRRVVGFLVPEAASRLPVGFVPAG